MASNMIGGLEVTTYEGPPRGFNPLTAESADLQKFGFPPRQEDAELQAKYERFLNRMKDKLHYVPATLRANSEVFHGPRQRLASAATEWMAVCQSAPDARALVGLAQIAAAQGQPEDAAVFASETLKHDPYNATARQILANCSAPQASDLVAHR